MANPAPLLALAAAAFFFLRKKGPRDNVFVVSPDPTSALPILLPPYVQITSSYEGITNKDIEDAVRPIANANQGMGFIIAAGAAGDRLSMAQLGVEMAPEVFAITYAPPLMDLFTDAARRASYRALLSVAYGLLAFGVYLGAVRSGVRVRLHAAYALYVFTAFKVYVFDLESQNQLYRAFSLLVFAAILFVSSHFASRQQRRQHA